MLNNDTYEVHSITGIKMLIDVDRSSPKYVGHLFGIAVHDHRVVATGTVTGVGVGGRSGTIGTVIDSVFLSRRSPRRTTPHGNGKKSSDLRFRQFASGGCCRVVAPEAGSQYIGERIRSFVEGLVHDHLFQKRKEETIRRHACFSDGRRHDSIHCVVEIMNGESDLL